MSGKTLLLAEDEMYVAMTLDDLLTEAGYRVFTAARLDDAMGVADRDGGALRGRAIASACWRVAHPRGGAPALPARHSLF